MKAGGSIVEIKSDQEFMKVMAEATGKGSKIVIDFTATWCGPCKMIAPVFEKLALDNPTAIFLKVDIDQCKRIAQTAGIESIPTFQFYSGEKLVLEQKGAQKAKLEAAVAKLVNSTEEELNQLIESGEKDLKTEEFTEGNLKALHDPNRMDCLNDLQEEPFSNLFTDDDKVCKSDVDEQLLITLAYKDLVNIKTIKFIAGSDDGPLKVKFFVNYPNMDFGLAEDSDCTAEVELTVDDLKEDTKPLVMDSIKFTKVDTLTIFVESNQGDEEQTTITQLIVNGTKN